MKKPGYRSWEAEWKLRPSPLLRKEMSLWPSHSTHRVWSTATHFTAQLFYPQKQISPAQLLSAFKAAEDKLAEPNQTGMINHSLRVATTLGYLTAVVWPHWGGKTSMGYDHTHRVCKVIISLRCKVILELFSLKSQLCIMFSQEKIKKKKYSFSRKLPHCTDKGFLTSCSSCTMQSVQQKTLNSYWNGSLLKRKLV